MDAITEIKRLRTRSYRRATGLTIAEGYPEVCRAIQAGVVIEKLYVCPEIFSPEKGEWDHLPVIKVSRQAFQEMAFGRRLKGVLAICRPHRWALESVSCLGSSLFIVIDGLEKPGNIGTIIRAADGAGCAAVLMCQCRTDAYNHNIVRSSIGAVFAHPVVEASAEVIKRFFKERGVPIFAASARASCLYTDVDLSRGAALVVGNEHQGISDFWKRYADQQIRIPMAGVSSSLNAAMSASILLYEARRQMGMLSVNAR